MDSTTIRETAIDRIEAELARLRAARPHLANRITTAEHILVTQLSTANGRHRPVKVRVRADGARSFTVRSNTKLRRCYTVSADFKACSCAWGREGNSGCSHSIAAWVMGRAG